MPRIIEQGTGQLGRAANTAAAVLREQIKRADEQRREADQMKLAERRIGLAEESFEYGKERDAIGDQYRIEERDWMRGQAEQSNARADANLEIAQKRAEQSGAIFERDMATQDADRAYWKDHARKTYGLEFDDSMSTEAMRGAMNIAEHRKQIESTAGTVEQLKQLVYERLNAGMQGPAEADGNGPSAADDRIFQEIEMMTRDANTLEQYQLAAKTLTGLVMQSHEAEANAMRRTQAIEMRKPQLDRLRQEMPDWAFAGLTTATSLYEAGVIDDKQYRTAFSDAEDMLEKAWGDQRNAMFRSVSSDFAMEADEKVSRIRELGGEQVVAPGVTVRGSGEQLSSRSTRAIATSAKAIKDEDERKRHVADAVKALVESGEIDPRDAKSVASLIYRNASQ